MLFDEVIVRYPLPDKAAQDLVFQTQSFDSKLQTYYVTVTGRLVEHRAEWEPLPLEEYPAYGTEDWDTKPWLRAEGMYREVVTEDRDTNYNGVLQIWCDQYAYELFFTDGTLRKIERFKQS